METKEERISEKEKVDSGVKGYGRGEGWAEAPYESNFTRVRGLSFIHSNLLMEYIYVMVRCEGMGV